MAGWLTTWLADYLAGWLAGLLAGGEGLLKIYLEVKLSD